jgi:hypothetical protein
MKIRAEFMGAVLAGAVAAAVGFAVFLLMHAIWIGPISPIAHVIGWAVLGGLMVGWAYDVHRVRLPALSGGRIALVFACASLVLAPGLLQLLTPQPSPGAPMQTSTVMGITTTAPSTSTFESVVGGFEMLLMAAAVVTAVTCGALLGRSLRAAVATGLAAFIFLIVAAHNLPFGFDWHAATMWIITLTVIAIAAVTLVVVETWISTRLHPTAGSLVAVKASLHSYTDSNSQRGRNSATTESTASMNS